ncbi:MAG TPA: hypothetical protein VFH26_03910 [Gemmatimonadales bacterium]|nr:hypothetical protein [Gemmatimonadales bacterium]
MPSRTIPDLPPRTLASARAVLFVLFAALTIAGCNRDNASPVALTESPDPPVAASVPSAAILAAYVGIPYGPFGLFTMNKLNWGPKPFTGSHQFINADTLILQINAARNKGQRLILGMVGGPSTLYTTNGQFDLAKWRKVLSTYNRSSLKTAVATAVSDGTVIGTMLIDEPETKQWGTNLTKPMIDRMAADVKLLFPTLPVGVNHGPPGYTWRSWERYTKVDYAVYQYAHWVTNGNITSWRDAVLARARADGVTPGLSLNVLNGGRQDRGSGDGVYDCIGSGQAGLGTRYPNCRMTPDQLRSWGKALVPYGCVVLMWRYNSTYMNKLANQDAFREVAALAASKPRRSCRRP